MQSFGKGVIFSGLAYLVWGVLPLYWKLLAAINPLHILAYRILFSLILVSCILFAAKKYAWLRFYRDKAHRWFLVIAALTITCNWGLYIVAVNTGHTIDASLGYYINPLLSIALGLIFFREKLNPLQITAVAIAFAGVAILTVLTGRLPLISLGLGLTFSLYSLMKKKLNLSALECLGAETLIAAPLSLLLLFCTFDNGFQFIGPQSISYWLELPLSTLLILPLCGVVTSLPLYLFSRGAKILPLSTLGFIQFLSPTLFFITGFFIFKESFPIQNFIAFGFIWTAVVIYIISLKNYGARGAKP